MTIYNGYADGETRTHTTRSRKADNGHSAVGHTTTRRGSAFAFTYRLTCECGWTASSKSGPASLGYRHDAHQRSMKGMTA